VLLPGVDVEFWNRVVEVYETVLEVDEDVRPPGPDAVGDLREEIEASRLFHEVTVRRHLWDGSRIHALVTEHGGVTETYVGVLNVAR